MSVWRIVKEKHIATALTGEGARLHDGRWNSPGHATVYTASSASLATLEMLVHLEGPDLLASYVLMEIVIPNRLIKSVEAASLPDDWRETPAPVSLRRIGDDWLNGRRSVAIRVPSAIVDMETNVLLNPAHPDFDKLTVQAARPFAFDRRFPEQR